MGPVPIICSLLECVLDLHQENQIPCLLGVQWCTAAISLDEHSPILFH